MDENFKGDEFFACPSDSHTSSRDESELIIFQIDKVRNTICAVSRKHKNCLLKSLQTQKCQSGAGLLSAVNLASKKL